MMKNTHYGKIGIMVSRSIILGITIPRIGIGIKVSFAYIYTQ